MIDTMRYLYKLPTLFLTFFLGGCYTAHYSYYKGSTYVEDQHNFHVDSAYLALHGKEVVENQIKMGNADSWIVDSTVYFSIYLYKEGSMLPIIPLLYSLEYEKKDAPYSIRVFVGNNKSFQTLDSIHYTFYDRTKSRVAYGRYTFNADISRTLEVHQSFKTPYIIEMKGDKGIRILGDLKFFLTDRQGKSVKKAYNGIEFKYQKGKYFSSYINS